MGLWRTPDGALHDDMDGGALLLNAWPKDAVQLTADEVAALSIPTLAQAQDAQNMAVDAAYWATISADIAYTTEAGTQKTFQADSESQDVLMKSVIGFDLSGGVPPGFFWKASDNQAVPFTLTDLHGLYAAMLSRGWSAFQRRTTLKQSIANAGTVAEVQAITWSA